MSARSNVDVVAITNTGLVGRMMMTTGTSRRPNDPRRARSNNNNNNHHCTAHYEDGKQHLRRMRMTTGASMQLEVSIYVNGSWGGYELFSRHRTESKTSWNKHLFNIS